MTSISLPNRSCATAVLRRRMRPRWSVTCGGGSMGRCGSTRAAGELTARTRRTTGRFRSAWASPAPSRLGWRRSRRAVSTGVPVVSRGGGTSLAGQACNAAVVIDWSKYCHGVVSVDPGAQTCVVEPGIVLDELNSALAPHGLMFGTRPATHDHCTLGGMLGNNSCGATARPTARPSTTYSGSRCSPMTASGSGPGRPATRSTRPSSRPAGGGREIYRPLRDLSQSCAEQIRERYPQIPRRVSGYNLDSLLPEHGFDVARALVGSESTLVTILHAELRLVPAPAGSGAGRAGIPGHRQRGRRRPGHRPAPARAAGGPRRPADHVRARAADEPRGPAPAAGRRRLADGHLLRRHPGRGRRQGAGADR